MQRCGIPVVLVTLVALAAAGVLLGSRSSSGQTADGWRQLSLPDFVGEIERLTAGTAPLSDALWTEIRSQSAERLLQAVAAGAAADYGQLVSLYLWARPTLTPAQVTTVLASLTPQTNAVSGWSLDKLQSVHARMTSAALPDATVHGLALAWLEGRDVRTLADPPQIGWLLGEVEAAEQSDTAPRAITVRWTGTLRAPADGQYVLSLSPVQLNYEQGQTYRRQTVAIWVGGQQVLDSAAAGGTSRAAAVRLTGATPVPLRVELTYTCSHPAVLAERPVVALLLWEGPGLAQRVVPAAALATGDGQPGLVGEYTVRGPAGAESLQRVDPQLNFLWSSTSAVRDGTDALASQLATQLCALATTPSTLAAWESAGAAQSDTWVGGSREFLTALTAAQRTAWIETLRAHPALLADCSRTAAAELYQQGRLGAPHAALQLWGTWAQAHADELPTLAVDFDAANRQPYRRLASALVWECPAHLSALEEDYLTLADGQCCLPAAYALAYAYWAQGQITAWSEKLDARLADEQLAGDARVGWLLARAEAEEICRSPAGRYWRTLERPLAGQGFLEEATLVARSEDVRLRACLELAARWTTDERIAAATAMLDRAQQRCPSAASAAVLAQWRTALGALQTAFEQRHAAAETQARDAYIARLRHRHQAAQQRGDSEATTRYEQLLTAAGATE